MGIEDGDIAEGKVQETQTGVSEEELARVREDMKKAAQVRGQIAQAAAHNRQYAQLLGILLQYVNDDLLLGAIFQQLITYKIEATGIFAQFIPYLEGKVEMEQYRMMFESVREHAMAVDHTAESLVNYLSMLRKGSEDIRKFPLDDYRVMVVRMRDIGGWTLGDEKEMIKQLAEIE